MRPGTALGLVTKLKMSTVLDFSLVPNWVYQSGETESLSAACSRSTTSSASSPATITRCAVATAAASRRVARSTSRSARRARGRRRRELALGVLYPSISESFYVDLNVST
jgi:hypothetical protein